VSVTTTEFLTRFFVEDLPFTPTARQIDESDLALVSPYLMGDALKEVKAGAGGRAIMLRPVEWRPQIFTVYNRKVAEHAQLFPVFHTFETAFRSTVAVTLEDHYRHPRWWRGIYEALRKGHSAKSIAQVSGVSISKDAAHLIGQIIYAIDGESFQKGTIERCSNGFEILELCELIHLRKLIENHWTIFSRRFTRRGAPMAVINFREKFDLVRNARNDVYHHKSAAKISNVVATVEELLDYLDCALRFIYQRIKASTPIAPEFVYTIEPRHDTW
jgi:hypothetical protein